MRAGKIQHAEIKSGMTVNELALSFKNCGLGAGKLALAVDIYEEMMLADTTKFLGLSGAVVPCGMRQLIADMIKGGYVDVVVTNGASLVHDMIEALGGHHYKGSEHSDDALLRRQKINRIFDVYLREEDFSLVEKHMQKVLHEIEGKKMSIREFLSFLGGTLPGDSILGCAARKGVPVFCPAIADSAIGLQAWLYKQTSKLNVDTFEDMREFMDICYGAKKTGAILLGGGVPKNFILQSMLVTPRGGFDYFIQITLDRPETGGLSGATPEEAKSWGKVRPKAKYVVVYSDITIALPVIVAAVKERLEK